MNLDAMDAHSLEQLATYAKLKAKAMRLREAGNIPQALELEGQADIVYNKLPEELKW